MTDKFGSAFGGYPIKTEAETRAEIIDLLTAIARSAYFDYNNAVRGNAFTHAAMILTRVWEDERILDPKIEPPDCCDNPSIVNCEEFGLPLGHNMKCENCGKTWEK